jgi:hypothetical protein
MGGQYNKNGRRKDPKKRFLMGNSVAQDQWEDQEPDGRMLFKGMHYRC